MLCALEHNLFHLVCKLVGELPINVLFKLHLLFDNISSIDLLHIESSIKYGFPPCSTSSRNMLNWRPNYELENKLYYRSWWDVPCNEKNQSTNVQTILKAKQLGKINGIHGRLKDVEAIDGKRMPPSVLQLRYEDWWSYSM